MAEARCQFNRKGDAVEAGAEFGNRRAILCAQLKGGIVGADARDKSWIAS